MVDIFMVGTNVANGVPRPVSKIEVRIDSADGELLGTVNIAKTKDSQTFKQFKAALKPVSGRHDLYFIFKGDAGKDLMVIEDWEMRK